MNDILKILKAGVVDPHTMTIVLKLILDLSDGNKRLDADTRLELQAELDTLTGGLV